MMVDESSEATPPSVVECASGDTHPGLAGAGGGGSSAAPSRPHAADQSHGPSDMCHVLAIFNWRMLKRTLYNIDMLGCTKRTGRSRWTA